MKRKLIINADDFGLTYSVNRAIIDVFKAGNLTSATLLVNMPGLEDAVELAKINPHLAIGLHFCITEGKPLSNCSSLIDEQGNFYTRCILAKRIIQRQVDGCDIEKELVAQLEKFKSFAIPLSHIDSHQHIHMIPFIYKNMLFTLQSEKLPVRIVDPAHIGLSLITKRPVKFLKQLVRRHFSKKFKRFFNGKINDKLASIHDLENVEVTAETYYQLVNQVEPEDVVELMVHPYILGDDVFKLYDNQIDSKITFLRKCKIEYEQLTQGKIFDESTYELMTYENI